MKKPIHVIATVAFAAFAVLSTGCAVMRNQETVGAYVDDTTITTQIKSRMAKDTGVDMTSISVETLKGTVQLSGFAKSAAEKSKAEAIAREVNGVVTVQNRIAIRTGS